MEEELTLSPSLLCYCWCLRKIIKNWSFYGTKTYFLLLGIRNTDLYVQPLDEAKFQNLGNKNRE